MGRPTSREDHELSKITNSVPQKQELCRVQRNPTGTESELELLKKIINNE